MIGGRYVLLDGLGRGLMGPVWRAEDRVTGRPVAVQELPLPTGLSTAEHAAFRERLLREARKSGALGDPGLLGVHDVLSDTGTDHVVTELLDAVRLSDHVASGGPLGSEEAAGIARGLLGTLQRAHAQDLVHGAVRPGAVWLAADGRIALGDVGLARAAGPVLPPLAGPFVAPEQRAGAPPARAGDLWGLGETLAASGAYGAPLHDLVVALRAEDPEDRPSVDEALAMLDDAEPARRRGWWARFTR
ncbi:hypothetical protein GCM10009836_67980 [Pseudonocardia ailaonensis]|uniref:non-specific serine/threonine protein kinase n=1 Tax=Pseudonocardia ailaonensis TaxID=367279 RepID=A0ABN2NNG0_9PSEU